MKSEITIVLGAEFDDSLRALIFDVLRSMGASPLDKSWSVGGSQEINGAKFSIGSHIIKIEAETYIGLSVSGDQSIVEEIVARVQAGK